MKEITTIPNQNQVKDVPAGTGPMYRRPRDQAPFWVTGAESGRACFNIEGVAPPGGGPPPRLEGTVTFQADGRTFQAPPGDFEHMPRGRVPTFGNDRKVEGKALVVSSPAGDAYGDARALLMLFVVVVVILIVALVI